MDSDHTNEGRPPLDPSEIDLIFRKLEPYLKQGLSLNRACSKAVIPKSTVYDLYNENIQFAEQIDTARSYFVELVNGIIHTELLDIVELQNRRMEPLDSENKKFVLWVASHSNAMKEYYCSDYPKLKEPATSPLVPVPDRQTDQHLLD